MERIEVSLRTTTGESMLDLRGNESRENDEGFEFTVTNPETTVELHARTKPTSQQAAIAAIREGRLTFEPGELEGGARSRRLSIRLHEAPGTKHARAGQVPTLVPNRVEGSFEGGDGPMGLQEITAEEAQARPELESRPR